MAGAGVAALALLAALAGAPGAGTVSGRVRVRRGGAAADAGGVVVWVVGFEEPAPAATPQVVQRGKRFEPELVAITAGQSVSFPNADPFFHNVFSPSPAQRFDLGQYPRGDTKARRFDAPGAIDVYCNIHPEMAATILVLPNRRFARAAADGSFRIEGVPPGRWTIFAYSRRATTPAQAPVEVVAGRPTEIALALDETRADLPHPNKYGERYRDPVKYR